MIVTKKALPRRTFLRGVGATLALPLLDAMVPAADRPGRDAGRPGAARLGFVYMPMGCDITRWTPPGDGHARRAVADPQPAGARSRSTSR